MTPALGILPAAQVAFWEEEKRIPETFVLYGGTALALRLGHRQSIDFDFFSSSPLDEAKLLKTLPFAKEAEILQSSPNTLTMRIDRGGPVTVSLFANLSFGQLQPPDLVVSAGIKIASLLDLMATKLKVIVERSESKDYIDIAALLRAGMSLAEGLGGAMALFGPHFNAALPLKALTYFGDGDLALVPRETQEYLISAAKNTRELPEMSLRNSIIGAL